MADVSLALQAIIKTGLTPVQTGTLSVSDNYQIRNDGRTFLHVVNGGGSADVVTIVSQSVDDGLAVADRTVSVPAGEERMIGPFLKRVYNDASGLINVTHSFITSVTHGAFRI